MSDCLHGLEADWCAICLGHFNVDHSRPILDLITEKPEVTVEAKFDGFCVRCENDIRAGEMISLYEEQWIHNHHFDLRSW